MNAFTTGTMRFFAAALLATQMFITGCTTAGATANQKVKLLAINDFHGQIGVGKTAGAGPFNQVGSAPILAAYLKKAQTGMEYRTIIVSAGDLVGASPADSALLQDEPSIMFMNLLANSYCRERTDPRCNVVATVGNHEFDKGVAELQRQIWGGNHADGPYLENPYSGAHYPYVAANVVDNATGKTLLLPYVIKTVGNTRIAFIGAVLKNTPPLVSPSGTAGLTFLDEADTINRYLPEIRAKGVKAIVAVIHQGGNQNTYTGVTDPLKPAASGDIVSIVNRLDSDVDVVISGHTHTFINSLVRNAAGKEVLVTQALSSGAAFADIDLEIDPESGDVVKKSAAIVTTFTQTGGDKPAVAPDPAVASLVAAADASVAQKVNAVIGQAASAITRTQNSAGESALGNLVADAQRAYTGSDFAFVTLGGIRDDIRTGTVTWGKLFSIQPFPNKVVKMTLTGRQIYELLAQQWNPASRSPLQISGLTYAWTFNGAGQPGTIDEVRKNGIPIDRAATYTVTTGLLLAGGGEGFTLFKDGRNREEGASTIDVLTSYIKGLKQPFNTVIDGRITRSN